MIQLTDNIYAVKVPEDASSIELYGTAFIVDEIRWNIIKSIGKGLKIKTERKRLPPGNWSFICTSKECTESGLKDIVKELSVGLRFENYNSDYPLWYYMRKESLHPLLRANGLTPEKGNYAIIKKEE